MTKKLLTESSSTPLAKAGKRFKAVVITPGQGSSGKYKAEMLAATGPAAFPAGTLAFADHPDPENPRRSVKEMIGFYPEGVVVNSATGGLETELEPFPHWEAFVEALAPHAGLSIYAMGEADIDGEVTALLPDRQNSIDLVAYAGRGGHLGEALDLTQMYEAASAASLAERTATLAGEKKETKMTPEQEALLRETNVLLKSFVAESKEAAEKLAKETADVDAVKAEAATERKAVVAALKLVNEADLPAPLHDSLVATVENGNTEVAPLIESAKATVKAIAESLDSGKGGSGHVLAEGKVTDNSKAKSDWASIFGGTK